MSIDFNYSFASFNHCIPLVVRYKPTSMKYYIIAQPHIFIFDNFLIVAWYYLVDFGCANVHEFIILFLLIKLHIVGIVAGNI